MATRYLNDTCTFIIIYRVYIFICFSNPLPNNGAALKKSLALSPDLGLVDCLGNTPLHQAVLDNEHLSLLQPILDSIKDNNVYR